MASFSLSSSPHTSIRCCSSLASIPSCSSSPPVLLSILKPAFKPSSLSWASSITDISFSVHKLAGISAPLARKRQVGRVDAAWTRRSGAEAAKKPNRKSWKQRTDRYMRPFILNVFFSKRFVHAKVMHRGTCKAISAASTNAKDLRFTLPSLIDDSACRTIGQLIAERSMEADVFAMAYELKKKQRIDKRRLGIIIDTIKENGIIFVE